MASTRSLCNRRHSRELYHNGKTVSQDIRKFLTGLEKAEMLEEWKAAPRQGS